MQLFIACVSPCIVMLYHIKTGLFAPVFLIQFPYMDQLDDWVPQSLIHCLVQGSSHRGSIKPNPLLHLQVLNDIVLVVFIYLHSSKNEVNN